METAANDPSANSGGSSSSNEAALPPVISPPHLVKGNLVNVLSRTWPGINKPGGIGKITKLYTEESTQLVKCVDVKYIVHGGTDKIIPVEFVEPHDLEGNRRRHTSDVQRCTRCKSFRSDCQSCDYRFEAEERQRLEREKEEKKRLEEENEKNFRNKGAENEDGNESMDSEEEEEYIAEMNRRYRRMCRQAKRRSNTHKKKKRKKQQNGKSEERQKEDTDSDEENETLGALIKEKKKMQRKKLKRRRQLHNPSVLASLPPSTSELQNPSVLASLPPATSKLQNPSVLASLPSSTTEQKVSTFTKSDRNKSAQERGRSSDADDSKSTSVGDEEEKELNINAESINQISIKNDTDDDEESVGCEDNSIEFDENDNEYEFGDQEASSDDSDDSDDDDDMKLVDLNNKHKNGLGPIYGDQGEIKNIIDDLLNTTILYANTELKRLKEVLKQLKRSMVKHDCLDEIDELAKKSNELHEYVVKELIRNGVDECNNIMRTLTKEKNTRRIMANMSKLERSHYKLQLAGLDLEIDKVGKQIEDVDVDVTNLQKEVDKLLDEAKNDLEDFFLEPHTTSSHNATDAKTRRRRNSSEAEWDRHEHATHKRKSSGKSPSSSRKRKKNTNKPGSRNFSAASHNEDFNHDTIDFDVTSDVEIESSDTDNVTAARYQSIDNDSIGETDDLDNGPAIQDTTRSWHTSSSSRSRQKESSGVQRNVPGNRRAYSKKRSKERTPTYRHIRREGRSRRVPPTTNSLGAQSRQSQTLIGMDRLDSGESQRRESLHSVRQNHTGHRQSRGQSSTNRDVQNFLQPDNLFAIQQDATQRHGDAPPSQIQEVSNNDSSALTSNTLPLNELCPSLSESHPQELDSCRETLSALSNSSPSGNEEVITLFQILHTLLKVKCSTLLDSLNCDPQLAYFQLDCWSLVFRLMGQNLHKQLSRDDVLWKVFGGSSSFARHVILQIIDVLFSQLMGDGYGDAPRLTKQVFGRMRSLCREIGAIVPILPELPNIFRNLPGQLWYPSLIYDQKENTFEKAIHVSMLDPKIHHERFMIEGEEAVQTIKENRRIDLYNKTLPRKEINALWTTIGFFTDASPVPSKKKERMLAGFVQSLLQSKCGVLYSSLKITSIPAHGMHLDQCLREIKWVCHLLSKSILGELSFAANVVPGIVKKAILLESTSVTLHMRPTAPQEKVDRDMRKLWQSSCGGASEQMLDGFTFNSLFTQDKIDDAWCFVPSTNLSQACASLIEIYAAAASRKTAKAYWNNFSREVDKLASSLAAKAKEADMTANARQSSLQTNDVGASFAHLFPELESFEVESVASPTGAFLRDAACFSLLACLIASTRSGAFIPTPIIALNKCFREKITNLSSDEQMQEHHKYYLEGKSGDVPRSTSNINLLFVSSKVLSLTTLLHLSVIPDNVERMGLDDDTSMLEYLTSSIISNLAASIDNMEKLNLNIKETRNLFDSSKSCVHVIKSAAFWLGLIFDRATVIIKNVSNAGDKMSVLHVAIKKLAVRMCSLTITVLTKALGILFDTASTNKLGKSLNVDLTLDKAFHCCLGVIRKVICFFHACRECSERNSSVDTQCNMSSVFKEYQDFMALKVIPTTIGIKKSDAQDLCCRQSVGLLCVLAALCSTYCAPQTLYKDIFHQRKQDDDSQLVQHLRTVFSCELTRLATNGFQKCLILAMQHFEDVLNDTIVSTFDYQSMMAHPTSNTELLLELGGEYSRRKGAEKLKKTSGADVDDFGYKDQNLWSFCEDAGKLFHHWNLTDGPGSPEKKFWINSVGQAIQSACAQIWFIEDGDSPQEASAEKECAMRRGLLRSIFASMKQKHLSFGDLPGAKDANVRSIAGCITKNVFFLSKTVSYYEEQLRWGCEDNDFLYKRAEIRAYEEAYIGFCASVLSDMLKENGHWVHKVKDIIVKRLEAPGVDATEKGIILKLLSRVFAEYGNDNGLGSLRSYVEAYCAIIHALKTCLCDLLANRTGNDAIKHIFSCALHIVQLQGKPIPNDTFPHAAYIKKFTNWLNICGKLMQEENLLPEMCGVIAKLKDPPEDGKGSNDPTYPKFISLGEAFCSLHQLEDKIFKRTYNPYAKDRAPSNAGQRSRQQLKLSRSCLNAIKNFIATSKSVV